MRKALIDRSLWLPVSALGRLLVQWRFNGPKALPHYNAVNLIVVLTIGAE